MKEVLPGIFWPNTMQVANCFFVEGEDKKDGYLIDTGVSLEKIYLRYWFWKKKIRPKAVLLTHSHQDHAGNVHWLAKKYGSEVYCTKDEKPYLTGDKLLKKRCYKDSPLFCKSIIQFGDLILGHPKHSEVKTFEALDAPFEIIPIAGHTPGSAAILHKPTKSLFLGDCLINCNAVTFKAEPGLYYSFKFFCEDWQAAKVNLKVLYDVDFENAFFGHGLPILSDAKEKILQFLQQNPI